MIEGTANSRSDPNVVVYNAIPVAEYYAALDYLTPCEQLLFEAHIKPGMAILDLGVGGGRTTPYLSSVAARYVGVDCATEMIARCRKKFPHLAFEVADAADLSGFPSSSFDAIVMAFNAIDYVVPEAFRSRTFQEMHRVLKPGGILIFSSHNPRALVMRASWSAKRVRGWAESLAGKDSRLFLPALWCLTGIRVVVAWAVAIWISISRTVEQVPTAAFWRGQGIVTHVAHGGLLSFFSTPRKIVQELKPLGFQSLRILGDDYPRASRLCWTDSYYYVFSKAE